MFRIQITNTKMSTSSRAAFQKRGFLTKQGQVFKTWNRRFFVLKADSLTYYESEDSLTAKGELSLIGASVVLAESPKTDKPFCLEIVTPTRTLYACAETLPELKVRVFWVHTQDDSTVSWGYSAFGYRASWWVVVARACLRV